MLPTDDLTPSYLAGTHQTNQFLTNLNANIGLLSSRLGLGNIYVIAGTQADTDAIYQPQPPPPGTPNLWRFGLVVDSGVTDNPLGDDLILEASTTLRKSGLLAIPDANEKIIDTNDAVQKNLGPSTHKEIMHNKRTQAEYVPQFLAGSALPFSSVHASPFAGGNYIRGILVMSACPVNLMITDAQNRHLGYDPETGQVRREIPGAIYTRPNVQPQIIFIPEAADAPLSDLTIAVSPYGSGAYGITVQTVDAVGATVTHSFSGMVTTGQNFTLSAPASTPTATPTSTPPAPTATPTNTPTATSTPTNPPAPTNTPTTAPLTRIKDITFEGATLTDPATGVDSLSGTVNRETAAPIKDGVSASIPSTVGGSANNGYLVETFTGASDFYASLYVRLAALPATSARIGQIRNGSTTVGEIRLTTSGTLELRNAGTLIGTSSALSVGSVYRIGIHQQAGAAGAALLEAFVASGDAPFGAAFAGSTGAISGSASEIRIGATNSNPISATFDDIRLDSGSMPPPSGGAAPTATPTSGPSPTPTNTPIAPTATPTSPPAPTNTPTSPPVPTNTPTNTPTQAPTATPSATPTTAPPPVSFGAPISLTSGNTGARPLAVADLNHDGALDVLFPSTALLGNGTGAFPNSAAVGGLLPNVGDLTIADLNADGKLDLAVAQGVQANTVQVLLGNGNGTFGAATAFATGPQPEDVVAGDFNGDGKLDLATANFGTSTVKTVSILLGTGNGTFQAATSVTVGLNPKAVQAGDLNGDGKLDLAVANVGGNSISVLLGTGSGTFQSAVSYTAGAPNDLALGDMNADGKLDLIAANDAANTVSLLLGNGNGTFQPASGLSIGDTSSTLVVDDVNFDGRLDIVAANVGASYLLVGKGNGTFQPVKPITTNGGHALAVADVNGDCKRDLLATNADQVNLVLNQSTITVPAAGGTRIKNSTFECGSLTHPITGMDTVNAPVGLDRGIAPGSAYAVRFPNSASGTLQEDLAATDNLYVTFYLRVNAAPASSARIVQVSNSGTTVGNIQLTSSRTLQLRTGATTIGSASAVLTVGKVYRVGLRQQRGTGGNAVLELYLAESTAPFGAPFAGSTTQSFTSAATRVTIGATNGNTVALTIDDLRLDAAVLPAP